LYQKMPFNSKTELENNEMCKYKMSWKKNTQ